MIRLWYQETVMDRKQSWGRSTGLDLLSQSHPAPPPWLPVEFLTSIPAPLEPTVPYQLGVNVRNGFGMDRL